MSGIKQVHHIASHLAFSVTDIDTAPQHLATRGVVCEEIRIDSLTDKRDTLFSDPDGLPLELYQA